MLMLDLCCGLGGASRAMRHHGWDVITLDIDPRFKADVIADIRNWSYFGQRPDLIWASPPCVEFSRTILPWIQDKSIPDMSIMLACKRIIDQVNPRYWVIENVKGAAKWFYPILGLPSYTCNPYYLWGYFPKIDHIRVSSHKEMITSNRAALRAEIPFEISNALAIGIEQTIQLFEVTHA